LPTNIMSITDGQWILDMQVFRDGLRPAISSGLSVTRVGARGHSDRQKAQSGRSLRSLTAYNQALEFSHFGAELAPAAQADLVRGQKLRQLLNQIPGESYSLPAQQLMLDIVLDDTVNAAVDIAQLKKMAADNASLIKKAEDYDQVLANLKANFVGART